MMLRAVIERRRRRESFGPQERRGYVLSALERPRTQARLRDAGMSSWILNLLRRSGGTGWFAQPNRWPGRLEKTHEGG